MKTIISVQYPSTIKVVVKTEAEMRALGYKYYTGDKTTNLYVNRRQFIQVKEVKRLVQEEFMNSADYEAEAVAACVGQTGMTPAVYQARHKRSWNE